MSENRREEAAARGDLHFIRQVLDQTEPSFRGLPPCFRRMGLVWLVCGLVLLYGEGGDVIGFLLPELHGVFSLLGSADPYVCMGVRIFLGIFLAVQCVWWQRMKQGGALSQQGRKLLSLWQVMLGIYLVLYVLLAVGMQALEPQLNNVLSWDTYPTLFGVYTTCRLLQSLLPLLFPALPLLLSGVYLSDRRLGALGVAAIVLYVMVIAVSVLSMLRQAAGGGLLPVWLLVLASVAALLKYLIPPVALLLVGRRLRVSGGEG